jgi:hypothetical protein
MKTAIKTQSFAQVASMNESEKAQHDSLQDHIRQSWTRIAPSWPLKNLIAVNPLAGFENLPFEEALRAGHAYFQQSSLPAPMADINRQSIKWLQAFLDDGQAAIEMPGRALGLFAAVAALLPHDRVLAPATQKARMFLDGLSHDAHTSIAQSLLFLGIRADQQTQFLTLMLTTLPGWAAYIKYRTEWPDAADASHAHPVTQADYLALRLALTCLLWPEAKALLDWHETAMTAANVDAPLSAIRAREENYRRELLNAVKPVALPRAATPDAQLVFCIDVRSEPFRRALEAQGAYETLGFAGFFGVPVSIHNSVTGESHASCPVLLKPAYAVTENPSCDHAGCRAAHGRKSFMKSLYQSLKYNFTTPFALVEALGPFSSLLLAWRNLSPRLKAASPAFEPDTSSIPFDSKLAFASGALRMMGLVDNFAPLVVFCGHGSETKNNAYATSLDCGACGGHHGAPNAKILAAILNEAGIRKSLADKGINIRATTHFMAAQHNTTTDEVTLYTTPGCESHTAPIQSLQKSLHAARMENSLWRAGELEESPAAAKASGHTSSRARDWAQVRPEWGLARNAAFIVGPRALTKNVNLDGRSFLHSYDHTVDEDSSALTVILTAPMVVAQWINSQYFFSSLDNVAYGAGSKISKNITGKNAIMQGNASDLMNGLPLQSVYKSDTEPYHEPVRLTTLVHAPRAKIDAVIAGQAVLQKLFGHGWVTLACLDPETRKTYLLGRDMTWAEHPGAAQPA